MNLAGLGQIDDQVWIHLACDVNFIRQAIKELWMQMDANTNGSQLTKQGTAMLMGHQ